MKIAVVELTDEEYEDLKPLLKRTNRNYKNFCQSVVLATIRTYKFGTSMFDVDDLGKINPKKQSK